VKDKQCDLERTDKFGNSSQSENKCCEFLLKTKSENHFIMVKENILISSDKIKQKQHHKKHLLDQKKSDLEENNN